MIETKRLTKTFGAFVAVKDLDLKVRTGSIHGFVGPNGAGKSTTLKMLIGAIRSTAGEGRIGGHPLGSEAARRLLGYSSDRPSFYRDMTAWDYLVHMAELSGMRIDEAESRARELLKWLELAEFSDAKVGGFSAGMKQRLSLALAMAHRPRLLLLDEPTANLDPDGRASLLEQLRQLQQEQGITIFISSHILPELEQLVDAVTMIDKGRIVAEDSISQLKQEISSNHYVLTTSDNEAVYRALEDKACVQEIHLDAEGVIHLTSDDLATLQDTVMEAVSACKALLKNFGEEQVSLDDIYRKTMRQDKDS
ncbi:MAG: ABC transporter ATP-binding protein [Chloroflexota bacterium]|nr:ABC transporter ATP-binding protein [Chloroflexota bacterium]